MQPPIYDPEACRPMWEELELVGVKNLTTPEEVDDALSARDGKTTLVMVNSVCGCAAGNARPGVARALQHKTIPDRLVTVFAGVYRDAVDQARGFMPQVPPSSPCIAIVRDSEPLHILERRHIEQMSEESIAANLAEAFDRFCERSGPSVAPEVFQELEHSRQCGSSIPKNPDSSGFRSII